MELSEVSTIELLDELESREESRICFTDDADGAREAIEFVTEKLGKEVTLLIEHPTNNCNFRRPDALEIMEHIVNRDGWDKVYAILEPYKVM